MLAVHRRRRQQQGQALILAMLFVAVFALIVGAVMRVGDASGLQHAHTEVTASIDSQSESGAAYAGADANRTDLPPLDCVPGNAGSAIMADAAHSTVTYSINGCNPGGSVPGFGGTPCTLCVLNQAGNNAYVPGFVALNDDLILCVNGDIDANGSVKGGTIETSNSSNSCSPANPPYINVLKNTMGTATCVGCAPSFTYFGTTFTDPLMLGAAGGQQIPTAPADVPSTGTCSVATPCSVTNNQTVLVPGVYTGIDEEKPFTMNPGVYVIEGTFKIGGNGQTGAANSPETGITLYLACPSFPGRCAPGVTGGNLNFVGNAASFIEAPCGPKDAVPCSGERANFAGMMVLAEPDLTGTALSDVGNGDSIGGTVDVPSGDVSIQGGGNGGGGAVDITGRLIANTVNSKTNKGHIGTGLKLTGTGRPFPICAVFDDTVGQTPLPPPSSRARAIVEELCSSASVTGGGLVYFNYSP